MKVLLIKDVYKLGCAGDVKKVADGYGRNFLVPKNLAVMATPGAMKQAEHIRSQATIHRAQQNQEMGSVAGFPKLLDLLAAAGFDEEARRKIAYGNWFRVLKASWQEEEGRP